MSENSFISTMLLYYHPFRIILRRSYFNHEDTFLLHLLVYSKINDGQYFCSFLRYSKFVLYVSRVFSKCKNPNSRPVKIIDLGH